jgi:hypothetical protein
VKASETVEQGRRLWRSKRLFENGDKEKLLRTGMDATFDPDGHPIDRAIEAWLDTVHGFPWRERVRPRTPDLTAAEARAITTQAAVCEALRIRLERIDDDWFLISDQLRGVGHAVGRDKDEVPPDAFNQREDWVAEYAAMGRRETELARLHVEVSEALSKATAALTSLKVAAQNRRRAQALATSMR